MALAKDSETGEEKSLPALALWRDPSDGTGHWRRAVVLQYDLVGEKFEVQYEDWCTGALNRAELHGLQSFHLIIRFADRLRIFILMYHIHMCYIIMSYDVFLYHDS